MKRRNILKKGGILLGILTLMLALTGCSAPAESENPSSDETPSALSGIMDQITEVPSINFATMRGEFSADTWEYHTKTKMPKGATGLVEDGAMKSQVHSVVLIELPEGDDVQAYADEILDAITKSPVNKWGDDVQAEKVEVSVKDNIILIVQSSETVVSEVMEAFNNL